MNIISIQHDYHILHRMTLLQKQPGQINIYLRKPFVRYLLVGGSAYVLEILIIFALTRAGINSVIAVGVSFWAGLLYSFILQKFFAFRDKRTQHKVVLLQVLMVCALVAFNFVFTIVLTAVLQHILPAIITRTIAIGITTIWNFYLYKAHIFRPAIID